MKELQPTPLHFAPLLAIGVAVACLTTTATVVADPPSVPAATTGAPFTPITSPTPPKFERSAMDVLKRMQTAMGQFTSYRAECWTTHTPDPSDPSPSGPASDATKTKTTCQMATLTAKKPNLMHYDDWTMMVDAKGKWTKRWEKPTFTVICDGKTHWMQVQNNYYFADKDTEPYQLRSVNSEPWDDFFNEGLSPYKDLAFKQLMYSRVSEVQQKQQAHGTVSAKHLEQAQEMLNLMTAGAGLEVQYLGVEAVEGIVCDKVFVHSGAHNRGDSDYRTTYYIDADGLLRRRVQQVKPPRKNGFTEDAVLRNIQVNFEVENPQNLFSYAPPKGIQHEGKDE